MIKYNGGKISQLSSLSEKSLDGFYLCQEQILKAHRTYCGVKHATDDLEQQIKAAIRSWNKQKIEELLEIYQHEQHIWRYYQFKLRAHKKLDDDKFWEEIFSQMKDDDTKQKFGNIWGNWKEGSPWAHYSSEALYQVAFHLLPICEDYREILYVELKKNKRKLDKQQLVSVKSYLTQIDSWLKITKISIANAMAQRLIVASRQQKLKADDVMAQTIADLSALNVIKALDLPPATQTLTPQYFNAFHDFIGRGYSKRAFFHVKYQTSWLKTDIDYRVIDKDKTILAMPRAWDDFEKPNLLTTLWHKIIGLGPIETYCTTHRYTIASLRVFQGQATFSIEAFSETFSQLAREVMTELGRCKNDMPTNFVTKLLFRSKMNRLNLINRYWENQIQLCADKAIHQLESSISAWEGALLVKGKHQLSPEEGQSITQVNQVLKELVQHQLLTVGQVERIESLSLRYQNYYQKQHLVKDLKEEILDELVQGKILGNNRLTPIYDHIENLKLVNEDAYHTYLKHCEPSCIAAIRKFTSCFNQYIADSALSSTESLKEIARVGICVKKLGTENVLIQMKHALAKAIQTYQIAALKHKDLMEYSEKALAAETIILNVAKQFSFTEIEDEIQKLSLARKSRPEDFLRQCENTLKDDHLEKLRINLLAKMTAVTAACWREIQYKIKGHGATQTVFERLLQQALQLNVADIESLKLQSYEKTLLGIHKTPKIPLIYLNQALAVEIDLLKLTTLNEADIHQFIHHYTLKITTLNITHSINHTKSMALPIEEVVLHQTMEHSK